MNEIPTDTTPDRYAIKLTGDSHFSWLRTRLSVVIAMIIAARQYRMVSRYLWSENFSPRAGIHTERQVHTPVFAISIGVIVIGLFAFASVVSRMM